MKKCIKITFCALLIVYFHGSFAMLSRTANQVARQQRTFFSPASKITQQRLATQRALLQTQKRQVTQPIKTAPPATTSISFFTKMQNSIQTYWDSFKNMFTPKSPTAIASQPVPPKLIEPLSIPLSPIGQSELSMFIPTATIQTLQAQALESASNVIKENRKEFDLKNRMDGLIVCGYPGPELLVLSKIESSKDFEHFFSSKRKQAFKTIGFSDNEIDTMIFTIEQNRKNVIKDLYTQPIATTERDQDLPKNIIETADKILIKAGINPDCVSLIKPPAALDKLLGDSVALTWGAYKDGETIKPAAIAFSLSMRITEPITLSLFFIPYVKVTPSRLLNEFIIAHEIGHIIKNHSDEMKYLENKLKQQSKNYAKELHKNNPLIDIADTSSYIFENVQKELDSLYELEADATVALLDPEIAQSISQKLLKQIESLSAEQLSAPWSPMHSSMQYKYELIQKILQIHALEKTQQQPHSAIE